MFLAMKNYPLSLQTILDYAEVPFDQIDAARDEQIRLLRNEQARLLESSLEAGKNACACLAAMVGLAVTAMAVNALFL